MQTIFSIIANQNNYISLINVPPNAKLVIKYTGEPDTIVKLRKYDPDNDKYVYTATFPLKEIIKFTSYFILLNDKTTNLEIYTSNDITLKTKIIKLERSNSNKLDRSTSAKF